MARLHARAREGNAPRVGVVRDLGRLEQILAVLVRHGFGEFLARTDIGSLVPRKKDPEAEPPKKVTMFERLRLALQDLGPCFVKVGQIASTRTDLLPPELITELKKLQDDVSPLGHEAVRVVVEESLGRPIDEVFARFDDAPLASASIGQVHRAAIQRAGTLEEVVVKVQRPGIQATIARDLDLLFFLARMIERAIPESKIYSPVALATEFQRAIHAELDFETEARHAAEFAQNFAGDEGVRFPTIHRELSGKRVLVMEFLEGKKIPAAVAAGTSGPAIARASVHVISKMIFEDGLFHADPHPGNILILGEPARPVLGLIDLGLVGRLDGEMRERTIDLVMAAVQNDTELLADALLAIGRPRGQVDVRAFRAEVARLSRVHLGKPLREVSLAALVRDLVQGAVQFDIEMPPELMLVGKALMTVEGIGREIDPDLDVLAEARPTIVRILARRYAPDRVAKDVLRGLQQLSRAAGSFPGQIYAILEDLRSGKFEVRSYDPNLPGALDRLGRRVYAGVTIGCFTLAGAYLVSSGHPTLGWTSLTLAGAQLGFHVLGDLRRKYVRRL